MYKDDNGALGTLYYGHYHINNKRSGFGTLLYPSADTYVGFWKDDCFDGKGALFKNDEWYKGDWKSGQRHGTGL